MNNTEYFEFLNRWKNNLPILKAENVFSNPEKTAIASVDLVNGFCKNGFLYSKRCEDVIDPNANLFNLSSSQYNVRDFFMIFDSHSENAVEFMYFPEHCTKSSDESRPVDKIVESLFSSWIHWIPKNSIGVSHNNFPSQSIKNFNTFIVTGVCTDICVYQLATFIKTYYNENNIVAKVIVPENCVNTYDSEDHPGDLYHLMFLYHMHINGIEVVKEIV